MVERRFCTPEVRSSILLGSTNEKVNPTNAKGRIFHLWTRKAHELLHVRGESNTGSRELLERSECSCDRFS